MLEGALDLDALGFGEGAGGVEVVGGLGFDDEIVIVLRAGADGTASRAKSCSGWLSQMAWS